jgi:Fur family ferric uptake transcriptional regulator
MERLAHEHKVDREDVLRTVRQAVRKKGVRWTTQREAIVGTFVDAGRHITAEELHQVVRTIDPTVSAATVYRTMNLLVEIGMAAKRHFTEGSAAFDLVFGKGHHHHLIDVDSGDIIEFIDPEMEELVQRIASKLGYRMTCHKIELFGVPAQPEGDDGPRYDPPGPDDDDDAPKR